ncbi:flavin-containing amine oxidoreductase-domain containing protein [Thamnocephalis sphaerospora]|uniref:Flavin-containing amine oxidoreductase-domain containing protein n=1 Tax=Thamnocephalis sphaerospora TaxID=78915 RepID=A0A4P9XPP1_9FUNG|nr:flavin-containing amine oxidoreductase-domain containing protein [Thamnocephalis sphaerospora]|eukprot:RKP07985.1 flavin-containing amine oxidoreductase-domain containing protein [Thamnocephalis sphaerospora]
MAGVGAARKLRDHGVDTVILEARNRVGGRIHSTQLSSGCTLDLGASFLHDLPYLNLEQTIKAAGVQVIKSAQEIIIPRPGQPPLSMRESRRLVNVVWEGYDGICRRANAKSPQRRDFLVGDAMHAWLDRMVDNRGVDRTLAHCAVDIMAEFCGCELNDLSPAHAATDIDYLGEDYVSKQGYMPILRQIAGNDILQSVHLEHVVTRVSYSEDAVCVTTARHGEFVADAVLVTLPLGVLKSGAIQFAPPLPAWKQGAVDRVGVGLMNKLVIEYDSDCVPFWPPKNDFVTLRPEDVFTKDPGAAADVLPRDSVYFVNYYALLGCPVLAALLHCGLGEWAETQSDEQMAERITRHLARYFPAAADTRPIRCTLTRWRQDPYAKGSYTHLPHGSSAEDLRLLAQPFGLDANDKGSANESKARVFWAGEHAESTEFGLAHGALISGQRAAKQLLTRFGIEETG